MRDAKRIKKILNMIGDLWSESPDERFGQFLINRGIIPDDMRVWIREDDELEMILKKWIKNGKKNKTNKTSKTKNNI